MIMRASIALLLVATVVCDLGRFVAGVSIDNPTDFRDDEKATIRQMAGKFLEIQNELTERVAGSEPEANLEAAKRMLDGMGKLNLKQKPLRDALKLFVSLEQAAKFCDLPSYKILAEMQIIVSSSTELERIGSILNQARAQHATTCRGQYKIQFREMLAKLDQSERKQVQIVQQLMDKLSYELLFGHGTAGERSNDLDGLPDTTKIIARYAIAPKPEAYLTIAQQIAAALRMDNKWDSFATLPAKKKANQLDAYLVNPCTKYGKLFGAILTAARFDASIEDDHQLPFLAGGKFSKAIANQRICKFVIDNRDQVYKEVIKFMS